MVKITLKKKKKKKKTSHSKHTSVDESRGQIRRASHAGVELAGSVMSEFQWNTCACCLQCVCSDHRWGW